MKSTLGLKTFVNDVMPQLAMSYMKFHTWLSLCCTDSVNPLSVHFVIAASKFDDKIAGDLLRASQERENTNNPNGEMTKGSDAQIFWTLVSKRKDTIPLSRLEQTKRKPLPKELHKTPIKFHLALSSSSDEYHASVDLEID